MKTTKKPVWHGVVLVAGGAIGAGMFALPIVSAGMWFAWAMVAMLAIWWLTYLAATLLVDINVTFTPGASFHTVVSEVLGRRIAWLNNLSITFIMVILMYAYSTAGASIIVHSLGTSIGVEDLPSRGVLSLIFAFTVGAIVWLGTDSVSRVSTLLMVGLFLSFLLAVLNLGQHVAPFSLFNTSGDGGTLPYLWAAAPVFVTAFACAGLVPSLSKHYQANANRIRTCLLFGTLIVLTVYIIWLAATLGTLPREQFVPVIASGGNIGDLVAALQNRGVNVALKLSLDWFSHFAIVTSFLSIGLGLFHFYADGFSWSDTRVGRAGAALLAFAPPAVMSFVFPYGFVTAIGYAGLLVAMSFFILPAVMHMRRFGFTIASVVVLLSGVAIALLKLLATLQMLPVLGQN